MKRFAPWMMVACIVLVGCTDSSPTITPDMSADVTQDTRPTIDVPIDSATDGTTDADLGPVTSVRLAHYNIEFLNRPKVVPFVVPQVQAAIDIVTRFSPDIVVVNEFEVSEQPGQDPGVLLNDSYSRDWADILTESGDINYRYNLGVLGNHAILFPGFDANRDDAFFATRGGLGNGTIGRLGYAIASRFPVIEDQARAITDFAWSDLPGNMLADLEANEGIVVPDGYPLFSKALAIIPFDLGDGNVLTVVALHAAAPVGHAVRPYRNRDELVALKHLIDGTLPGVDPLPSRFVLMGDFNADPDHGDAFPDGILGILDHPSVSVFTPTGPGTVGVNPERNTTTSACPSDTGPDPSTGSQFQLDYLLPSVAYGMPTDGGMFFPDIALQPPLWQLACRASNHMMLWADIAVE